MRTNTFILTSLMLYLLGSPVFSDEAARPVNTEFLPVESGAIFARPVVYEKSHDADAEQVMFYIPVYTMTLKKKSEPAVVPVKAGSAGGGVIMPIYNNIDINRSKSYPSTQPSPSSSNNPSGGGSSASTPDNPNISDGAGGNNGLLPDFSVPDTGKNSSSLLPSDAGAAPVNKNKDLKIVAAAPIIAGGLGAATFKKGTTIKVKSCENLTSEDKVYKRISFVTTEPVVTTYSTIPIGTKIDAHIIKNKKPGALGNGALISLKADRLIVDESKTDVDGIVVKTREKRVFFNNIKGERTYLKGIAANTKEGRDFYRKMALKSQDFLSSPKTILFAPFPILAGAAGIVGHAAVSPFSALKNRGAEVFIVQGSDYELKLKSDCSRQIIDDNISEKQANML